VVLQRAVLVCGAGWCRRVAAERKGWRRVWMTTAVAEELSRCAVTKACCRRAEMTALLRFCGGVHVVTGRVVVAAELDASASVRRLRAAIGELYGYRSTVDVRTAGTTGAPTRYVLRVVGQGAALARHTGLTDTRGRQVRGLPAPVIAGGVCDAAAVWRGAFLAHGSLTEPGRSTRLQVDCPGPEAAMALVGAARRLGVAASTKHLRAAEQVVVRDEAAIIALLNAMGAPHTRLEWERRRRHRAQRSPIDHLPPLQDANLHRATRAALVAAARVERALQILGPNVPENLTATAALRVTHRQASLEKLGTLTDPPLTKDAVAGRIRRLLAIADHEARRRGVPDTESALTPAVINERSTQ